MHERETDAGAGKLVIVMQALEHAEQPVAVARIEARAVVAHEVDVLPLVADARRPR